MAPASKTLVNLVLFDFDGTLTLPGALDFPAIQRALGCPLDHPILEFIHALDDATLKEQALVRLDQFEIQAACASHPNDGAVEIVGWIKRHHMAVGILTRNSRVSVLKALERFSPLGEADFDILITRDEPVAPKPSGDGIQWAAHRLNITPEGILMVGDYIFDCQAGQAAGARTVLLDPRQDPRLQAVACDFRIKHLNELKAILLSGGAVKDRMP